MSDFREFKYYSHSERYENGKIITENNKFEMAGLDYGKDGKLSLYIFLPDQDSSLQEFYKDLTADNIDEWINKMFKTTGYIIFPKFKSKQNYNLKTYLSKQGINLIFDNEKSNLSKMVKLQKGQIAYVDQAFQDSFIDVNEEGSEAAAVTVIVNRSSAASSDSYSTLRFMANRPFFYIIRDNETKSNLFMGSVANPEYKD